MRILGSSLSLFMCVMIATYSPSVTAGETCDAFTGLQEGEFYHSFDRELGIYRLNETMRLQYDGLKIELMKALDKADANHLNVEEIRGKLKTLAQNASKLCTSPYPRGSRVSRSTLLATIELLDKDLRRSLKNKLDALRHDLVTEYVRNGLDECKKAEQALRAFADVIGKKHRRPRDLSKLKKEIEDRLDEIDVAIARYEIMMKEKRTKAEHIEEMVLSINRICNSSPIPEIKQPDSMLHWLRCPLGQSWNGMTCKGKPKKMNWESAKRACPVGYRLPSREELIDILGRCEQKVKNGGWGTCNRCADSKSCAALFSKDTGWYWSSTPVDKNVSWRADFGGGYMAWGLRQESNQVRCVARGPKE